MPLFLAKSFLEAKAKEAAENQAQAAAMARKGMDAGFVDGCVHSEKLSLQANMAKHAAAKAEVGRLKVAVVERGGGAAAALKAKLAAKAAEAEGLHALVWRQQTIKKLWRTAHPLYLEVAAELNETEQELASMLGT